MKNWGIKTIPKTQNELQELQIQRQKKSYFFFEIWDLKGINLK